MFRRRSTPSEDAPPPYSAVSSPRSQPHRQRQGSSNPLSPPITPGARTHIAQPTNRALSETAIARTSSAPGPRHRPQYTHAAPRPAIAGTPGFPVLPAGTDPARVARQKIARETLAAMAGGSYSVRGVQYDLTRRMNSMIEGVRVYGDDTRLEPPARGTGEKPTQIEVLDMTTLNAVRWLDREASRKVTAAPDGKDSEYGVWDYGVVYEKQPSHARTAGHPESSPRIGVLNSASPHIPGGDFRSGDAGQELSVSRASTLSAALETPAARPFYHAAECSVEDATSRRGGLQTSLAAAYHTHALVYTPGVTVIREETGGWTAPRDIDVITCTAVHAGDARAAAAQSYARSGSRSHPSRPAPTTSAAEVEDRIRTVTTARLRRILAAFAHHGVATLVLPAFGAGTFQHTPAAVARVYAELLLAPRAPFKDVFERVVFAIPGTPGEEFSAALWTSAGVSAGDGRGEGRRTLHGSQRRGQSGSGWLADLAASGRIPKPQRNGADDPALGDARSVRLEWDGGWASGDNRDGARGQDEQEDPARGDARSVFSVQSAVRAYSVLGDQDGVALNRTRGAVGGGL
ncbi:hypothetical protein HYPSUDRAFT_40767 [Hypholoma sublateritium FD-334 SS-4]|uniref:Microbial-type PARG catalytic domain-containing protein n=1 Tax=Hypholoma sublateritium (strain FD-334 SS-4) TaxID=945553 RepID=A0A0D2MGE8_HYPSF|nr:hypothetical protein HYPSUDRAFT_40767 [Hypholoma sublateritium FD-334 SS-4]